MLIPVPRPLKIIQKHPRNMNHDGTGTVDVVITNTSEVQGKRCLGNPPQISNLKDEELSGSSPSVFQLDDRRGQSHKLPLEKVELQASRKRKVPQQNMPCGTGRRQLLGDLKSYRIPNITNITSR